jgi:hypothetical protein
VARAIQSRSVTIADRSPLDQVQRPQPLAGVEGLVQLGHQHVAVVVAADLTGNPEADGAGGHVSEALDHAAAF